MLLPDIIHPKYSIYYNGAIVIRELKLKNGQLIFELYHKLKKTMSFPILMLSLDWLFLIDVAIINDKGEVELC